MESKSMLAVHMLSHSNRRRLSLAVVAIAATAIFTPSLRSDDGSIVAVNSSTPQIAGESMAEQLAKLGTHEVQLDPLPDATSAPVITAIAASHDGRYLAVAGDDHAIRVIDSSTGEVLQTMLGHIDWIRSLTFAYPEADSVAPELFSSGNDGRVLKWEYKYPVSSQVLFRVPYAVRSLTVSTEQKLIAIGGFSKEILLLDYTTGLLKHKLECDCDDQYCVRFSPSGERVLCSSRDGEIRVWNTATGELITEYKEHVGRVRAAIFSKDGSKVTSAGDDRNLMRFDLTAKQVEWKRELGPSKMMALCLINEDLTAVAGSDNKIRIFDGLAGIVVAELEGHTGTVAAMTPCGNLLASGSFDTTVRFWNLATIARDAATTIASSPSESRAAVDASTSSESVPVSHAPFTIDKELRIR